MKSHTQKETVITVTFTLTPTESHMITGWLYQHLGHENTVDRSKAANELVQQMYAVFNEAD